MTQVLKRSDPKYVDHLSEDPAVGGQKFCCISFVSPDAKQKCDILGFKIRGSYDTEEIAKRQASRLREMDPDFDVFICKVGYWIPFSPDPSQLQDEVFAEEHLNDLVRSQKEGRVLAKQHYDERKQELMRKALSEGARESQASRGKEHLISLRTRIENTDDEIKRLQAKLTEALNRKKEDLPKLKNYTPEEVAEANEIEKKNGKVLFNMEGGARSSERSEGTSTARSATTTSTESAGRGSSGNENVSTEKNETAPKTETQVSKTETPVGFGVGGAPQSVDEMQNVLESENILTHSQRQGLKQAGKLENKPEEYEL
ncbi:Uncharacterised protein [uncultured archaeon]|nr:Uncharacterised protein [uncultured archaeon]